MEIHCSDETSPLHIVAVAKPAFFHQTTPINERQKVEYERDQIDVDVLLKEHDAVVTSLVNSSVQVVEVVPHPELPYLLNIRDACVVIGSRVVSGRMHRKVRESEPFWVAPQIVDMRSNPLLSLDQGSLEGGDVLQIRGDVVVGLSERTDREGASALSALLPQLDVTVVPLKPSVLHLDTVFNFVGHIAIIAPKLVADAEELLRWCRRRGITDCIEVTPDEAWNMASNFLAVGPTKVIIGDECPRVVALLEKAGVSVDIVSLHEHHRIGGSVRCMTLPLFRGEF